MADKKLEIEIRANVTGEEDVGKLKQEINGLGKEAVDTGKESAQGAQGIRRIGQDAAAAAPQVDKATEAVRDVGTAAVKAESQLGATRRGLVSVSEQLADTQKRMGELRDTLIAGFSFNQFVQAAAQMESVQAGLQAVSGSSTVAGEQMDFVRRMANAAGVDVAAAGQSFLGLAAATKGTAVEGEPARQVFEAVSLAMAKAGKSSADTQNALLALSQIAGKGTVSMEELRGQLGEALPGALQATANGLGITTQDLIKLVETGQLAAEDMFPALAKGLDELYGGAPAAQTLTQEITNIKNAFVEMSANIGEEGGLAALKVGAEIAQSAITLLGDTLIQTGQYIGTLAGAVATLDFSGLSQAFEDIETQSRERLLKAAEHTEVLRNALKLSSNEAIQAALAAREQGQAAADAGAKNAAAAPGVAALGVAYAEVRKEVASQIVLAEKEVEAIKARGQASIAQAAGLADEKAKREALAKAAADEAAAMTRLADLRETELNVLKAELAARQALQAQSGADGEARKKEIAELEKQIAQKQIDVDKTRAQAAASQEKAKANSAEVLEAQALTSATQALAVARNADAKVALSSLQAQKELARQAEQMAVLMGDEEGARRARILQLEIEIKLVKARADVATAEANGSIAVARANMEELRVKGQLTPLKEAEITASIKLAEAKIVEAKAMGQSTELLEKQLELIRNNTTATNTNTSSLNDNTRAREANAQASRGAGDAIDQEYAARMRNTFAIDAENRKLKEQAERKRLNMDAEGFSTDKSGNRIVAGGDLTTLTGIQKFLEGAGLTKEQAKSTAREFADSRGNIPYFSNPGQMKYGGASSTISEALLKAAERITFGTTGTGGTPAAAVGRTVTVNINTPKGPETVTTDEAGAQALIRTLQTAGLSAGR